MLPNFYIYYQHSLVLSAIFDYFQLHCSLENLLLQTSVFNIFSIGADTPASTIETTVTEEVSQIKNKSKLAEIARKLFNYRIACRN